MVRTGSRRSDSPASRVTAAADVVSAASARAAVTTTGSSRLVVESDERRGDWAARAEGQRTSATPARRRTATTFMIQSFPGESGVERRVRRWEIHRANEGAGFLRAVFAIHSDVFPLH